MVISYQFSYDELTFKELKADYLFIVDD